MKGFRIDFAMNRDHEMTLDRESGIERSELDHIELNMLHGRKIPYFLPMDWFELDGKVTFRYTLTGSKMLLHRLQQHPLTMDQYYRLVLGITDALNECRHYMLRPEGCLLDEQFIFIGEQLHDIKLAYVPIKEEDQGTRSSTGDLLSLIVRFTTFVDRLDGEGLKRILQHLNEKKWPISELRSTLLELINGSDKIANSHIPLETKKQLRQERDIKLESPKSSPQQEPMDHALEEAEERPVNRHTYEEPYLSDATEDEAPVQPSKKKWIITAGLIIAVACIWRFIYFAYTSQQALLISAGISLLLLAGIIVVWKRGASQNEMFEEEPFELKEIALDAGHLRKLQGSDKEQHVRNERHAEPFIPDPGQLPIPEQAPIPPAAEPTVLLRRDQAREMEIAAKPNAVLKRSWRGQEDSIELKEASFKIGRAGEHASYTDQASGVSRLHVEIEDVDGEYRAKDLGSRNGSLLNGQAMIPYKAYKLSMGDVIHLAGTEGPSYELTTSTSR